MADRTPNAHLERLYRETGWTVRQFAQAVNRIGVEQGMPLSYQPQSPFSWLKGYRPREAVRPMVLEPLPAGWGAR